MANLFPKEGETNMYKEEEYLGDSGVSSRRNSIQTPENQFADLCKEMKQTMGLVEPMKRQMSVENMISQELEGLSLGFTREKAPEMAEKAECSPTFANGDDNTEKMMGNGQTMAW